METLEANDTLLQSWRIVKTPPQSGEDNMRYDVHVLDRIERGNLPPTLRFFRFKGPTVSYGRLQKQKDILPLVPRGWSSVQRPTGGGVVFHEKDLCLSLCWPVGHPRLPARPREQYRWIHAIILDVLQKDTPLGMAACGDVLKPAEPFAVRSCFNNPVGYDLLRGDKKIVGGALRCTRRAVLYQGSIQLPLSPVQVDRLVRVFTSRLVGAS